MRNLEALAVLDSADTRQIPSLDALLAVQVVPYTGLCHCEELLKASSRGLSDLKSVPLVPCAGRLKEASRDGCLSSSAAARLVDKAVTASSLKLFCQSYFHV